jgi:hypothetical protein
VGRDQIRARLWTSDIHVDYDNAINSAVRKLRDSLGDTAENPRFIETVARRGYRFVAPVSPKLPAAPLPSPVPAKARRWRLLAIPVALAAVVAGLAFWGAKRDTRAALNRGNVEIQPDPNRRLTAGNNRSTIVGRAG